MILMLRSTRSVRLEAASKARAHPSRRLLRKLLRVRVITHFVCVYRGRRTSAFKSEDGSATSSGVIGIAASSKRRASM
jgi:hypothetical protein